MSHALTARHSATGRYDPNGETFIAFAPYGAPSANYFPWLVAGAVALAVGTITVIAWIARRIG